MFSEQLSTGLILFVFLIIVLGGVYKKIDIFSAFAEGAKEVLKRRLKLFLTS
jgi:hypothetical protein